MLLPDDEKYYRSLDIIPQCDGQTDGHNCYNNIVLCMHCMLTRDKNVTYDFLSVTHGPIWYYFRNIRRFRSKNAYFLYSVLNVFVEDLSVGIL